MVSLEHTIAEALRPVIREELERALHPRLPDLLMTEQAARKRP